LSAEASPQTPRPLAVFRGPTSKRRGGEGEEGREGREREFVLCPRKKKIGAYVRSSAAFQGLFTAHKLN